MICLFLSAKVFSKSTSSGFIVVQTENKIWSKYSMLLKLHGTCLKIHKACPILLDYLRDSPANPATLPKWMEVLPILLAYLRDSPANPATLPKWNRSSAKPASLPEG